MTYEVRSFTDLPVMPLSHMDYASGDTCGGPIWPEWEDRTIERHWRHGKLADKRPDLDTPITTCGLGQVFWCGFIQKHFGHQVGEFSMRIIPSLHMEPAAKLMFAIGSKSIPPWFGDLMNWCGVEAANVLLVHTPALAKELHVVPQAEQLTRTLAPAPGHLDVMDRFVARKGKPGDVISQPVFISRAGLNLRHARLAGEEYIERCVRDAGGLVFRPETASIGEQMALYRSAKTLVFTEGSALHMLQLAGRSFNAVHVLGRRPGVDLFSSNIRPRCRSYKLSNVTQAVISALNEAGDREDYAGISIPIPGLLVRALLEAGCDIRQYFDMEQFRKAAHADLISWLRVNITRLRRRNWQDSDLNVVADLRAAGLTKLAEKVLQASRNAARVAQG